MIKRFIKRWVREEDGLAATEAAMIFPILCFLLLGVFDVGRAIVANQKAVRASQVIADLIARGDTVTNADVNDAIAAGRLAFEPLDVSSFGVDIISVRFDNSLDVVQVWRRTENMTPVANVDERVESLAQADEGVIMVAVEYNYTPIFVGFISNAFRMQEIGFSRGRQAAVVNLI